MKGELATAPNWNCGSCNSTLLSFSVMLGLSAKVNPTEGPVKFFVLERLHSVWD